MIVLLIIATDRERERFKSYNVMNPNKYSISSFVNFIVFCIAARGTWRSEKKQSNGLRLLVGIVSVCFEWSEK